MALNHAKCCHKPRGRVWSSAGIWKMQKNQWLSLSEFQTDGTDTENAREAKLELTVTLKNWWTEEDLSCLVGWWLERISWRYGGNNECLALKPSSPILNCIVCLIGSQWREHVTTVALSDQETLATVLASKFWICCNLSRLRFEVPYGRLLQ